MVERVVGSQYKYNATARGGMCVWCVSKYMHMHSMNEMHFKRCVVLGYNPSLRTNEIMILIMAFLLKYSIFT